tara:strand:+ start:1441 stop:1584 length:144 start_codon:yes stop_codon:yes gene_type:complete
LVTTNAWNFAGVAFARACIETNDLTIITRVGYLALLTTGLVRAVFIG